MSIESYIIGFRKAAEAEGFDATDLLRYAVSSHDESAKRLSDQVPSAYEFSPSHSNGVFEIAPDWSRDVGRARRRRAINAIRSRIPRDSGGESSRGHTGNIISTR